MRRPSWLAMLFFTFCFLTVLTAWGGWARKARDDRISQLQKLVKERGPYVRLSVPEYTDLVMSEEREYNVAMLIVAGAQYECAVCATAFDAFVALAREYKMRGKMNPVQSDGKLPTFFVYLDVTKDPSLLQLHGLKHVPILGFFEPKHVFKLSPGKSPPAEFPAEALLGANARGPSFSEVLNKFITTRSGNPEITITKPERERIMNAIILLGLAVFGCWAGYQFLLLLGKHPAVMAACALVIQILATSGLCYSIINGFQWVGFDRRVGKIIWFSPYRRHQFAGEGLIISTSIVASGMFIYAGAHVMKHNTFKYKPVSYLASLILAACGLSLYLAVMAVDGPKRGPPPTFYPPADYVRGPLRHDRGNVF